MLEGEEEQLDNPGEQFLSYRDKGVPHEDTTRRMSIDQLLKPPVDEFGWPAFQIDKETIMEGNYDAPGHIVKNNKIVGVLKPGTRPAEQKEPRNMAEHVAIQEKFLNLRCEYKSNGRPAGCGGKLVPLSKNRLRCEGCGVQLNYS